MLSDTSEILAGKHALVTGGARGIGAAVVSALVRHGARVSVVSRSPGDGKDDYFTAQADVSDEEAVRRAFAACRKKHGPVEILVNNSGISDSAPLTRTSKTLFDSIIATNL